MKILISKETITHAILWIRSRYLWIVAAFLSIISIGSFFYYYSNGLGLAYSDARSHLDIGRRVVESLKPGLAQIGSVWLPLPHLLMVFTIWNDWMWHSGLAGSLYSMASFVASGVMCMLYLRELGANKLAQVIGGLLFAANLNLVYLQSTAMTEVLLMGTMTAAAYYFLKWSKENTLLYLIYAAFWTLLSTLVRYDGWFLCAFLALLVAIRAWWHYGFKSITGMVILFSTLAGFGIFLWVLWNTLIFRDPLYFISGPYSARAQQKVLEQDGKLPTKGDWGYSLYTYAYGTVLNLGMLPIILGLLGLIALITDRHVSRDAKLSVTALFVPFIFNVIALFEPSTHFAYILLT